MTARDAPRITLTEIFATPFAEAVLPLESTFNESLRALFTRRPTEERRDALSRRDPLCYLSREDVFEWQEEPVVALRSELLAGLCSAVLPTTPHTQGAFGALGVP